jgi:hypothetical protein
MLIVTTVHHGNGNTAVARYIARAVNAVNNVAIACAIGVNVACAGAVIIIRWILAYSLKFSMRLLAKLTSDLYAFMTLTYQWVLAI